jgi:hypothetical protein
MFLQSSELAACGTQIHSSGEQISSFVDHRATARGYERFSESKL